MSDLGAGFGLMSLFVGEFARTAGWPIRAFGYAYSPMSGSTTTSGLADAGVGTLLSGINSDCHHCEMRPPALRS